jgi:hypothetical protein
MRARWAVGLRFWIAGRNHFPLRRIVLHLVAHVATFLQKDAVRAVPRFFWNQFAQELAAGESAMMGRQDRDQGSSFMSLASTR